LNVVRIVAAMLFIWLAGTLPLQPILPGQNVAGSKDVRFICFELLPFSHRHLGPICNPLLPRR
jgi:hypothetical protein